MIDKKTVVQKLLSLYRLHKKLELSLSDIEDYTEVLKSDIDEKSLKSLYKLVSSDLDTLSSFSIPQGPLNVIASVLENPENPILANCEDHQVDVVAQILVNAADEIKEYLKIAEANSDNNQDQETVLTPESLDDIAAMAASFDASDDDFLKKQASVLDEILLTFAAPKDYVQNFKKLQDSKVEDLKKRYKEPKEKIDEYNKASEAKKALEESAYYKQYRPLESALSGRNCVDHPGAMLARVGEHTWQCSLDKKIYNYESGFTTMKGNKVPGGSVEFQTPDQRENAHVIFDTRDGRLGS